MRINRPLIVVSLVVVVVLALAAAIAMLPPFQGASVDPSQLPDAANASLFFEEIAVEEERVVARFVPWDPAPANYTLSYRVKRGTSGDDRLAREAPGVSRYMPIDVIVPRRVGEEVTLVVEIYDESGALVYASEGTYA